MLAVCTNIFFDLHDTGPRHPERQIRLEAAMEGLEAAGLRDAIVRVEPCEPAPADLVRVHDPAYLDTVEALCANGGGHLDPDTPTVPGSWSTALLAAGAGLATIDALRRGIATAGMVLCRPPGHHATRRRGMGFCLINSIAVAAASLVASGERVAIFDWDVHHGNGTQDIFWNDSRVLFASTHQAPPHYPGTGAVEETGGPDAKGATINVPLPPGTTGDVVLDAFDSLIGPAIGQHAPTWLLVSAGFDAHRDDPLAGLSLTSADFADLTRRAQALVPNGRIVFFLEGGYDLAALRNSVGATAAASLDVPFRPESPSSGGPGSGAVLAARRAHADATGTP